MGIWGALGAPEFLQKGGGEAPRPNEMGTEAPGAAETPKMTDFRSLNKFKFPLKVLPRLSEGFPALSGQHRPRKSKNSMRLKHGGDQEVDFSEDVLRVGLQGGASLITIFDTFS